jgi:hypothetical protein
LLIGEAAFPLTGIIDVPLAALLTPYFLFSYFF